MAPPDDNLPDAFSNFDAIAFRNSAIGIGQLVDAFSEAAEAGLVVFDGGFGKASSAVESNALGRRLLAGVGDQIAAHEIIRPRHP